MAQLESNELDVIVQIRKLGEGYDHPYLSVAAVFSVFANLSPFVQFVGRIMRVIDHHDKHSPLNQGTVVFHAGANITSRWEDFQEYSEADQEFFDQLLPVESLDFSNSDELSVTPKNMRTTDSIEVRHQSEVRLEEIPLIQNDQEAMEAIQVLRKKGYTPEQVHEAMRLEPVPTTKIRERQAMRKGLDDRVRTEAGKILAERSINTEGHELDRARLGRTNLVTVKSAIDRKIKKSTGKERDDLNRSDLDTIEQNFSELVEAATNEVFNAAS